MGARTRVLDGCEVKKLEPRKAKAGGNIIAEDQSHRSHGRRRNSGKVFGKLPTKDQGLWREETEISFWAIQ